MLPSDSRVVFRALIALLSIASGATACGVSRPSGAVFEEQDGGTLFGAPRALSESSVTGRFVVELRSAPAALPQRGENRVQLTVLTAENKQGVPDLRVELVPCMPAMGHGSTKSPVLAREEAGVYEFQQVWLTMPGRWQLITAIHDENEDEVVFELDID